MRTRLVAGNWKMNKTVEEARSLVFSMLQPLREVKNVQKVICPPALALLPVSALLQGSEIGLGAQNMHWEAKGAFTGEISAEMLAEFCQYVILGHSERRQYFGEIDETVNKKIQAALGKNLTPIVCVGETLSEYEAGSTGEVVTRQLVNGLSGLDAAAGAKLVIAYEPVWAIGTGKASSAENAEGVHRDIIRPALVKLFGTEVANQIRILYGGSVTAANASELFAMPNIDGALVGGASLKPDDFVAIVRAAA